MDTVEKIIRERGRLLGDLERAQIDKDKIEEQIRNLRSQIGELEAAMRVIGRFEGSVAEKTVAEPTGTDFVVPPKTKREAMHAALLEAPGSRVNELIRIAKNRFDNTIAKKTAGNLLWQLKGDGLARREGLKWFPVTKGDGG